MNALRAGDAALLHVVGPTAPIYAQLGSPQYKNLKEAEKIVVTRRGSATRASCSRRTGPPRVPGALDHPPARAERFDHNALEVLRRSAGRRTRASTPTPRARGRGRRRGRTRRRASVTVTVSGGTPHSCRHWSTATTCGSCPALPHASSTMLHACSGGVSPADRSCANAPKASDQRRAA